MHQSFQKQALKVMALILLCGLVAEGVSRSSDLYIKPLQTELRKVIAGPKTYDCLASQIVREEQARRDVIAETPKLKQLETRAKVAAIALGIVQLGLLYLFSCFIVRVVQKPNESFNPTAPPPAGPRVN